MWVSGCLGYRELLNILPRDVKDQYLAERTQKLEILNLMNNNLMNKEVEIMDYHACPKIRDLIDYEADGEMWICSSYRFLPKTTLHCAERKAKLLVQSSLQHLKL